MKNRFAFGVVGLAAVTASLTLAHAAQQGQRNQDRGHQADPGEMQLPPGMTEEMAQACIEAGIPGEMHEHLAERVGVWNGECTMWMYPGAEPMTSTCTYTISPMMDGRFVKGELSGEMPGMGPYNGFGITGFDNVSEKFQGTWIDNHGTGMMIGTGELSADGKTLEWEFKYNCPVTKKPVVMREIERYTGKDAMTLEMHGVMPGSDEEFKMMEIKFTRKPGRAPVTAR